MAANKDDLELKSIGENINKLKALLETIRTQVASLESANTSNVKATLDHMLEGLEVQMSQLPFAGGEATPPSEKNFKASLEKCSSELKTNLELLDKQFSAEGHAQYTNWGFSAGNTQKKVEFMLKKLSDKDPKLAQEWIEKTTGTKVAPTSNIAESYTAVMAKSLLKK